MPTSAPIHIQIVITTNPIFSIIMRRCCRVYQTTTPTQKWQNQKFQPEVNFSNFFLLGFSLICVEVIQRGGCLILMVRFLFFPLCKEHYIRSTHWSGLHQQIQLPSHDLRGPAVLPLFLHDNINLQTTTDCSTSFQKIIVYLKVVRGERHTTCKAHNLTSSKFDGQSPPLRKSNGEHTGVWAAPRKMLQGGRRKRFSSTLGTCSRDGSPPHKSGFLTDERILTKFT